MNVFTCDVFDQEAVVLYLDAVVAFGVCSD